MEHTPLNQHSPNEVKSVKSNVHQIFLFTCLCLLLSACATSRPNVKTTSTIIVLSPTSTAIATKPFLLTETLPVIPTQTIPIVPTQTIPIIPTQTSTPGPALVSHTWSPIEPLISFGASGGDGGCGFEVAIPEHFYLFSNGELFIMETNKETYNLEMMSVQLSRQSTCKLLNSLDQAGFFDYDPNTYVRDSQKWEPPVMGGGSTHITVNAWRNKTVSLYDLHTFIYHAEEIKEEWGCGDCPNLEFPTILPSIRKTYQLLTDYKPENLQVYQPRRLGLWVDEYPDSNEPSLWSYTSINLSQIISSNGDIGLQPNKILTGENASQVFEFFHQSLFVCGINVKEGEKVFRVFARPLLPNEFVTEPQPLVSSLSCFPEDGWIELP